mmetsp:Transcript_26163/g.68845  ORF Transcript_26163/g.68845 Transcript_26163/m.68845 type:complete len:158 (-) Transcript_26163:78-551(-)
MPVVGSAGILIAALAVLPHPALFRHLGSSDCAWDHTSLLMTGATVRTAREAAIVFLQESAGTVAQAAVVSAISVPNGPAYMNMTKMNQDDLPAESRHQNGQTESADWGREYEVFEVAQDVAAPNTAPETHIAWTGPMLVTCSLLVAATILGVLAFVA